MMTKDEFRKLRVGDQVGRFTVISIEKGMDYEVDPPGFENWQVTFDDHHTLRITDPWLRSERKPIYRR